MTLATIGMQRWPLMQVADAQGNNPLTGSILTFDSTTDRLAYVGQAYQTDSISKIYLRSRTITLGDTVEVRIETVVNGRPSGTLWSANGTGANPKGTIAIADADDNVWKSVTLTNAANVVPGDQFAIVVVWSAESGGAGINMQFGQAPSSLLGMMGGMFPAVLQDTGAGTWALPSNNCPFEWVVEMTTAGVVHMPGLSPLDASGTITAYNNSTNPNERGAKFVPPMKCRVVGISVAMFNIAAGGDFTVSLWDATDNPGAAPTPLGQASLDGDVATSTTVDGIVNLYFAAPVTLTAGTTYYMGVRADTANNIGFGELPTAGTGAATNAIRAFGIGSNTFHLATRQWVGTDPGVWSLTTTIFPLISLIIDQLDDGAGGAGGGMRLAGHGGLAA